MTKNINEVISWLDGAVGNSIGKPNGEYKGQCVSLVQSFLAWLIDGYNGNQARGDAKDYNASPVQVGDGKFTININKSMGGGYGHIWIDYSGMTWEQNNKPLTVTKNTAGSFSVDKSYNLDPYINYNQLTTPQPSAPKKVMPSDIKGYSFVGHVQNLGDLDAQPFGGIIGTTGKGLRLENVKFYKDGQPTNDFNAKYHVENMGWTTAGTEGKALRLEDIILNPPFKVKYRAHIQSYGWLPWEFNGDKAGSEAQSLRMEALQIERV